MEEIFSLEQLVMPLIHGYVVPSVAQDFQNTRF